MQQHDGRMSEMLREKSQTKRLHTAWFHSKFKNSQKLTCGQFFTFIKGEETRKLLQQREEVLIGEGHKAIFWGDENVQWLLTWMYKNIKIHWTLTCTLLQVNY